jgi:hypothetical protein
MWDLREKNASPIPANDKRLSRGTELYEIIKVILELS